MARGIKILGLVFPLILVLAACGGEQPTDPAEDVGAAGDEETQTGEGAAPEGNGNEVTVTWSNWQFAEPGRGERLQTLVDEYNASQDEVFVETVSIPYPRYAETITTQLGGGGGPDIVNFDADPFFLAVDSEFLVDITDMIEVDTEELARYDATAFFDDRRYGIVWEALNYGLIMNKTLLEEAGVEAPTTYEELLEAARATTTGGQYGFAFRHTLAEETGWWFDLSNWVYGFCGSWTDSEGNPTINTPEVAEAVSAYQQFIEEGLIPRGTDAATYRRMAWEGLVAMMIDNSAVPAILIEETPEIADDLAYAPIPFECPENTQISIFTGVNANSEHPEAAAQFMNYLLQEDTQEQVMLALGGSATAREMDTPEELAESNPWLPVYAEVAPDGKLVAPEGQELLTAEIRTAVLRQVDRVINEGVDVQEALDEAQAEVESIVAR